MFKNWNNITKISLISFFSSIYFYLPILTIYYQQKGLNFIQINSLWGFITGAIFIAEIPTGVIADKIGRKASIIIALILQLFGEFFFLFAQNYIHFVLISILAGVAFAFQSGCTQALVYDSLKEKNQEDKMKQVTGTIGAFLIAGQILGAFASSFIIFQVTQSRITLAIILTIISVAIALLISLLLEESTIVQKHVGKSPLKIISSSITTIKGNPSLRRIILLGLFTTPFINYLRNLQPPYFHISHVPSVWLGLSLTIGGLMAVLASKFAYKIENLMGVGKGIFLATILPAIFYILMSFLGSPLLAILLFTLNFGSMSLQDPLFADYYNRHITSENRATVLSTINMISSMYITFIGLLIGWIADHSIINAFLFMGITVLLGAIIFRINESHVAEVNRK